MSSDAQVSLLKHQVNYAATNIVKSSTSEDELIKTVAQHLMRQQEMYQMLVQLQTEGGLGIARHRQIDKLLAKARGEA